MIPFLQKFLKWNASRCDDIEYTAANFVFYSKFLAMISHVKYWKENHPEKPQSLEEYVESADDVLGITHIGYGITNNDHKDEQYFYIVDLSDMFIKVDDKIFGFAENPTAKCKSMM